VVHFVHQPATMRAGAAMVGVLMLMSPLAMPGPQDHPFEFLGPTIQFSEDDRAALNRREIVLRILHAEGHELAVLTAGAIDITPGEFIASVRNIPALKKGSLVPQIGRFSPTPRLEDLQSLTLDDTDVDAIRRCRLDRCGLKLAPDEIARLHRVLDEGGSASALDIEFRRVIVERAKAYLRSGDDRTTSEFSSLVDHSPYVEAHMPQLVAYLIQYPHRHLLDAESFLYWSKETYAWKPMITVTHITIVRGEPERGLPEVLVVSRDVFSTRYTSGSFIVTMLLRDTTSPSLRYLVYVNRTWVDGVRALWRPFVEHRLKSQARKIFEEVRQRLERGIAAADPVRD
jgi:hypothetical protein